MAESLVRTNAALRNGIAVPDAGKGVGVFQGPRSRFMNAKRGASVIENINRLTAMIVAGGAGSGIESGASLVHFVALLGCHGEQDYVRTALQLRTLLLEAGARN